MANLAKRKLSQLTALVKTWARRPPWRGECDHVTQMLDYHGPASLPAVQSTKADRTHP